MTYCWNNVDIPIAIQRNGVYKHKRQGSEVVLAKPFGAGHGEFRWHAVLLLR